MHVELQHPFRLGLTLLEPERRYGSSHVRLELVVMRFDEHLQCTAKVWLANDAWDAFVSRLAAPEPGEAVLQDLSHEFRLHIVRGGGRAEIGVQIAAKHVSTPDVCVTVRATDLDPAVMDDVCRGFLRCERWWSPA